MKRTYLLATLCGSVVSVQAALPAHYDFTDGDLTDNDVEAAFTLTKVTNGVDDDISLATLNNEGPQLLTIPEPTTGLLAFLSLPILLRRRR